MKDSSRNRRWMSITGVAGGLAMFAIEALIVATLVAAAWVVAVTVLALS